MLLFYFNHSNDFIGRSCSYIIVDIFPFTKAPYHKGLNSIFWFFFAVTFLEYMFFIKAVVTYQKLTYNLLSKVLFHYYLSAV
ncbi:hypothetical protein CXF74_11845 [Psychromonas sp. Urea-02u-13]|nr:hypothetical protein CXF74_11845 [Psychromonas sp. Urea-02u-13]